MLMIPLVSIKERQVLAGLSQMREAVLAVPAALQAIRIAPRATHQLGLRKVLALRVLQLEALQAILWEVPMAWERGDIWMDEQGPGPVAFGIVHGDCV